MWNSGTWRSIEEICVDYHDDRGSLCRRQLYKRVVEHSQRWCVVLIAYQDWRNSGRVHLGWQEPRWVLMRFEWVGERWREANRFNLSGSALRALGMLIERTDARVRRLARVLGPERREAEWIDDGGAPAWDRSEPDESAAE